MLDMVEVNMGTKVDVEVEVRFPCFFTPPVRQITMKDIDEVLTADVNSTLKALGNGFINLIAYADGYDRKIELNNVYYVPKLYQNLLSVSIIERLGNKNKPIVNVAALGIESPS
ncbi:hypothetical protein CHUAL_009022 [Chamberlinius hualienensis]